jgi:hypothetical protein
VALLPADADDPDAALVPVTFISWPTCSASFEVSPVS